MAGFFNTPKLTTYQLKRPITTTEYADPFPFSRPSELPTLPGVVLPPMPPSPPAGAGLIARPPVIDRFPIVVGANLTGQYLSAAYRNCTYGYRYQFCDLLAELFEHDPHARGVSRQRVLPVSGARVEVQPAMLPAGDKDEKLAAKIAEEFESQLARIPALRQALGQLNWAVCYGVTCSETGWDTSEGQWEITGLSHIHTRRLNYTDPSSWDLFIYDQGLVGPGLGVGGPTNGVRGLRISDYQGKFVVHTPALSAEYSTRDGEARYAGTYMLLKRMVVRASAQDFERTVRPWVVGYFNRLLTDDQKQTVATPEDQAALERALTALGSGSMNNAALPDSVKIEILKAASAMNATEFLSFLNREISKCFLGQAFTTEPGANGNLSTSEMAAEVTLEIQRYDALCLSDSLERDLITPWFRLNYESLYLQSARRLAPRLAIRVEEKPDPDKVMKRAVEGTQIGMPIDIDKLAEQTGLPVVAKGDKKARRTRMTQAGKAQEPEPKPGDPDYVKPSAAGEDGDETAKVEGASADDNEAKASKTKSKPNGKAEAHTEEN